jgi:hypothetical protein
MLCPIARIDYILEYIGQFEVIYQWLDFWNRIMGEKSEGPFNLENPVIDNVFM